MMPGVMDIGLSVSDDYELSETEQVQQQIKSIPFGALIKAKEQLAGAQTSKKSSKKGKAKLVAADEQDSSDEESEDSDDDQDEDSSSSGSDEAGPSTGRRGRTTTRHAAGLPGHLASSSNATALGKRKKAARPHARENKHAPTEISSKRPVKRARTVVDWKPASERARDPRFDPLSGALDKDLFKKSYGHIGETASQELADLRKALKDPKRANKLDEETKAELEAKLRREESRQQSAKNASRDSDALRAWKKAEREKQKTEGKKPFFLKKSAEKDIMLKAKFENLLGTDKRQLKKAVDRKRKKVDQKEKKKIPRVRVSQ